MDYKIMQDFCRKKQIVYPSKFLLEFIEQQTAKEIFEIALKKLVDMSDRFPEEASHIEPFMRDLERTIRLKLKTPHQTMEKDKPVCNICKKPIDDWTKEGMFEPFKKFWVHQDCYGKDKQ